MKLFDLFFGKAIDRRIAAYQNDLITKHCDEVDNIYRQMRIWRHDYHNHIQAMLAMTDNPEELRKYLWMLNDDLTAVDTVLKTGNVMVDAILNSNLCAIIGNLLDNAMEACLRQSETGDRFIRVYIGILKKQLYICVTNSVGGEVKKVGRTYLSTKDSDAHGFGLMRIDRLADKYDGYVNRQNEDGAFATEVMLPL